MGSCLLCSAVHTVADCCWVVFLACCFLGSDGTGGEANKWRDLKNAKAIAYTCYQMYAKMKTGIAPEYVDFRGNDDLVAASRVRGPLSRFELSLCDVTRARVCVG